MKATSSQMRLKLMVKQSSQFHLISKSKIQLKYLKEPQDGEIDLKEGRKHKLILSLILFKEWQQEMVCFQSQLMGISLEIRSRLAKRKKRKRRNIQSKYFYKKYHLIRDKSNKKLDVNKCLFENLNRWGSEYEKTFHPPLLNFIPNTVNDDDLEYIIRLYRLDEIQNKMSNKSKTIFDDDDCRSPSPPYVYNETGKRINTRD